MRNGMIIKARMQVKKLLENSTGPIKANVKPVPHLHKKVRCAVSRWKSIFRLCQDVDILTVLCIPIPKEASVQQEICRMRYEQGLLEEGKCKRLS